MKLAVCIVMFLVLAGWWTSPLRAQSDEKRVEYEPTWESLDQHATPEWYKDAKLGLFIYGPGPDAQQWARHRKLGGRRDEQIAWDNIEWDPEALAKLAVDAGARYIFFSADGYSEFVNWPSRYAGMPGSAIAYIRDPSHPKVDYVGELARAVRGKGLKFGIYRNYLHPARFKYWFESMYEMIDRYHPDLLYLDGDKLSYPAEELKSRQLLAYYYNHSPRPGEVACEDALGSYKRATFGKRLVHGDWYRKESGMAPPAAGISDGWYERYEEVGRDDDRSPVGRPRGWVKNYIDWLVHCAGHGGNLHLAIWVGPPSYLEAVKTPLSQVGDWLKVNGGAIYGTRPWYDGKPQSKTTSGIDVRFTTKGDSLYAILLDWPAGDRNTSVVFPHLRAAEETQIRLLGRAGTQSWRQSIEGLAVALWPSQGSWHEDEPGRGYSVEIPGDHAFCLEITPRPTWAE